VSNKKVKWVPLRALRPPHRVTHPDHLKALTRALRGGWDPSEPVLVGYNDGKVIQLLSGSHRFEAARAAGFSHIPVVIHPYVDVMNAWGDLSKWWTLMDAPSLRDTYA
jgi:hypothetical protein